MCLVTIFMLSGVARDDIDENSGTTELMKAVTMILDFRCFTEDIARTDYHLSARAGYKHHGKLYLIRWEPGSVVSYAIGVNTFPTESDAKAVGDALDMAAADWNERDIGVQFKRAAESEHPVFTVKFKRDKEPTRNGDVIYAKAFFPSQNGSRVLRIFGAALAKKPDSGEFLANVFRHELGHVLGLRHEDADQTEPHEPSVQLIDPNEASIMRSVFTPGKRVKIQPSDVKAAKTLYKLKEGDKVDEFTVQSVDPATLKQEPVKHQALNRVFPGEARLVGPGVGLNVANEHNITLAVCFAISVSILFVLAMTPRITVICSSRQ